MESIPEFFIDGYLTPLFEWDKELTSKKLQVQEDPLRVKVIDGSGFKSTLGNANFEPGERYFFQINVIKGQLLKIGVSRKDINVN